MEEEKVIEQAPVKESYEQKIQEVAEANRRKLIEDISKGVLHLRNYQGVSRFKSIRRAIRRGHVSPFGDIYPDRPFNNRKRYAGITYERRRIYEQVFKRCV